MRIEAETAELGSEPAARTMDLWDAGMAGIGPSADLVCGQDGWIGHHPSVPISPCERDDPPSQDMSEVAIHRS
jgi:hypothetical protein